MFSDVFLQLFLNSVVSGSPYDLSFLQLSTFGDFKLVCPNWRVRTAWKMHL